MCANVTCPLNSERSDDFIPGKVPSKSIDHRDRFNIFSPLLGKVTFGPSQEPECANTAPVPTLPHPAHPFNQLCILNGESRAPNGWTP